MKLDLDIVIAIPGMPVTAKTLAEASLGGSETAGLQMAAMLARYGHHVLVFANTPEQTVVEDRYLLTPFEGLGEYVTSVPHDVLIVQRVPEVFVQQTSARLNVLWQHDLALGRTAQQVRGVLWNIDKIFVLSEFQKRQYQEVYDPTDALYYVTRNGIDLSYFEGLDGLPRAENVLLYTARPERGLDALLRDIMPRVWKVRPDIILQLATYQHRHPSMDALYDEIDRTIGAINAQVPGRVKFLGHLPKRALAEAYAQATLYVYPTPSKAMDSFAEISCISAMEAQAAGTPIVASAVGALPETVDPNAGVLVKGNPWEGIASEEFAQAVLALLADPSRRTAMGAAGVARAKDFIWAPVAIDWSAQFWNWIDERNNRASRLTRHMVWLSDIVPSRAVVDRMPATAEKADLVQLLDGGDWSFVKDETWKDQYEKPVHDLRVFDGVRHETRHQWLMYELQQRPQAARILDVGCAHGAYQIWAANLLDEREQDPRTWVGTDISEHSIRCCEELRSTKARRPERHTFLVGTEEIDLTDLVARDGPFDLLVAFEVLEHVPKPWEFLAKLERWVKPGGEILITVPSGPWEAMSYPFADRAYPHRFHIWHFDIHDLRDMLAHKPGFSAGYTPHGRSDRDGAAIGWWFVVYTVGDPSQVAPPQPIDLDRHLRLQRPKETLSATIMVGPSTTGPQPEETLHWCLRSVAGLADEIVVVDNGMSDECRRILAQYPIRTVRGVNPLEAGFEAPRNIGVTDARMDWVLWIDTDERLMEPGALVRYLRANIFDGYGIRQHHFACDTTFTPDLPVRIFRNTGWRNDGKPVRFWGMIHEHPETQYNEGPGKTVVLADLHLSHIGYLVESTRRRRFARNNPLLQRDRERYPDRQLGHHFEIRDNLLMVNFLLERSGGRLTDEIRALCRKSVALYQAQFLGKPFFLGNDTLNYYSQALRVLGEGFDYVWAAAADKTDAHLNGDQRKARFASVDDLVATLRCEAEQKTAPFASRYW